MSEKTNPTSSSPKKPQTLAGRAKRLAFVVGIGVALGYGLLLMAVLFFEDSFIYFPVKYPDGDWDAPVRHKTPRIEDVYMRTPDGVKLHGWYAHGQDAEFTLLYMHGNAGNITNRYYWLCELAKLPTDIFIIDYRGYGKSTKMHTSNSAVKPSEAGLYTDSETAYRYLVNERDVQPQDLIIYGNSLGGAVAAHLAAKENCAGLIMQSSFTSAANMAKKMFGWMPLSCFVSAEFDNIDTLQKVTVPKLILHGKRDHLIPHAMAEQLYEVATEPKQLVLIDKLGHNDFASEHSAEVLDAFREFLSKIKTK